MSSGYIIQKVCQIAVFIDITLLFAEKGK